MTASLRKSVTDLTRRRARSLFTIVTLALAVASVSFLAVPTLIDRALQDEVRAGRLADLTLSLTPVPLGDADLAALAALPGVEAVEPRSSVDVRVLVGERRAPARIIGVRDWETQRVDVVRIESGAPPREGEVVADVQDANVGLYDGDAGDELTVLGPAGTDASETVTVRVTGRARSLPGGEYVQDENAIVLYAPAEAVAALSGEAGYGTLAFRLRQPGAAAAARVADAARAYLETVPGFAGLRALPEARAPGDWPGKAELDAFANFLAVITLLALLSAVVLTSNTMTTLVAEQTGEIGIMRSIGARRGQVALVYLRTALLLGAAGALLGAVLGVLLSSLLADYFGTMFWAVDVPLGVDATVLVAGVVLGLVAPPLAALPAIGRAVRLDLRSALQGSGSAAGGPDSADRLLRRASFLPRTVQIGLRGVGRRRRRSLATVLIVALAVANMLACLALAAGASRASQSSWGDHLEDVRVFTLGRQGFDARAEEAIRATPGVAVAQPALFLDVELRGRGAVVWGMAPEPLFRYRVGEGRWYEPAEERSAARVAVIERNLAQLAGVAVGDPVELATPAGRERFRVVGIAENQQEDGLALFVPLATVRDVLGDPDRVGAYWIRTDSPEPAAVDRTTALLEDRLAALGIEVATELTYVAERDEIEENRTLTTSITVLGLLIVAMSMVGLANAITMSILERTREIGVLRSIGARARDVRGIFATEGVTLAVAGWLLGIPLGYLFTRLIVRLLWEVADVRIPVVYPLWNPLLVLAGTVVIALLVLALPLRRAVRLRPGDAIRYA